MRYIKSCGFVVFKRIDNANYYLSNDQYVAMYGPINVGSDEYGFVPYSKKD